MNTEHKTETTDDELVARFDNKVIQAVTKNGDVFIRGVLHFHSQIVRYKTSFDWIMPVVEKINSSDISRILIHEDVVHYHLLEWQKIPINGDLIGAIYKAVTIVLRWAEK